MKLREAVHRSSLPGAQSVERRAEWMGVEQWQTENQEQCFINVNCQYWYTVVTECASTPASWDNFNECLLYIFTPKRMPVRNYMVTLRISHSQSKRDSDLQWEESSKEIIWSFACTVSKLMLSSLMSAVVTWVCSTGEHTHIERGTFMFYRKYFSVFIVYIHK